MTESGADVIFVGTGRSSQDGSALGGPSLGERAKRFVGSELKKHSPEAHTEAIMKRYFWVTDRLEGKPREIADKFRPMAERLAKVGGWGQTGFELYLAGQAVGLAVFMVGRKLPSVGEVFGRMGRQARNPGLLTQPEQSVQPQDPPVVPNSPIVAREVAEDPFADLDQRSPKRRRQKIRTVPLDTVRENAMPHYDQYPSDGDPRYNPDAPDELTAADVNEARF